MLHVLQHRDDEDAGLAHSRSRLAEDISLHQGLRNTLTLNYDSHNATPTRTFGGMLKSALRNGFHDLVLKEEGLESRSAHSRIVASAH